MARCKTYASAAGEAPAGAGKAFLKALATDFGRDGKKTIQRVREQRPLDYLKLIGALLPALSLASDSLTDDISDEEFAKVLAVVRAAIAEQEREEAQQAGKTEAA